MRHTEQHFLGYLLDSGPMPEPVLEVGVGWEPAFHWTPFAARGYSRFLTQDMRTYADSPAPDFLCDVCDLAPVADASVGTVLCFNVLEHCHAPWEAVAAIHRVLAEGGVLVGSVPLRTAIHRHDRDYWRFCPDGIAELLGTFRLEHFVIEGNPQLPANLLFQARRDCSRDDWRDANAEVVARPYVITDTDYLTPNPLKKLVVRAVRAFGYDLGLWTKTSHAAHMQRFGYHSWTLVPEGTHWPVQGGATESSSKRCA